MGILSTKSRLGSAITAQRRAQIDSRVVVEDAPGRNAGAARGSAAPNALEKIDRRPLSQRGIAGDPADARAQVDRQIANHNRQDDRRCLGLLDALHRQCRVSLTAAAETWPRRQASGISSLLHLPPLATGPLAARSFGVRGRSRRASQRTATPAGRQDHADGRSQDNSFKEEVLHWTPIITIIRLKSRRRLTDL
jgi:hypothetical protein